MVLLPRLRQLRSLPLAERCIATAFLLLIALAPLWYGGALRWSWAGHGLALGLIAMALAVVDIFGKPVSGATVRRIPVAAALYCAVVIWVALQATSLTPTMLHHPVWAMMRETLGIGGHGAGGAISINPEHTWTGLIRLVTAGLAFFIAFRLGRHAAFTTATIVVIALAGAVYALYGLFDFVFDVRHVLFTAKLYYTAESFSNYVSGTFINRNHFASYAGISLLCAVSISLKEIHSAFSGASSRSAIGHKAMVRSALQALSGALAPALLIALISIAIVLSMSRAGLASAFASALFLALLNTSRSSSRLASIVVAGLILIGTVILLLGVGEGVVSRADGVARNYGDRAAIHSVTLSAALNAPWLGHGYAAFIDMFPLFRDQAARAPGLWNAAHNDYAELAATLGFPAFFALIASLGLVAARCAIGAARRRRDFAAPMAAAGVTVQLALHSLVDFPLHLDAIAITYASLLGVGLAQAWNTRESTARLRTLVAAGPLAPHRAH